MLNPTDRITHSTAFLTPVGQGDEEEQKNIIIIIKKLAILIIRIKKM